MTFDPQRFAMDYHIIGFRECASEVARYLVTIEGMDIQDPLRLRLMSHLQCFVAQRELSAKSSTATMPSSNWSSLQNTYQPNYPTQGYQTYPSTTPQQSNSSQHNSFNSSSSSYMSSTTAASTSSYLLPQSPEYSASSGYASTANNSSSSSNVNTASTNTNNNNTNSTSPSPVTSANDSTHQQQQDNSQQQPIYTDLSNSTDRLQLNLSGNYHYGNAHQLYANGSGSNAYNNNNNNNNSKPYRPWHPEMAY
jgi:YRPW motif-containing protein